MFISGMKLLAAGTATISIAGSGVGLGIVFGNLMLAISTNPTQEKKLFGYAMLGFALTEAIAFFGLMIVLLILFGF
jgi:F-type H+-transporting ATPase subunit c